MCGIAGFVYKNTDRIAEKSQLKKMTDSIFHRGPDAEGLYSRNNVALGHRRLSIIDLSLDGNQPMISYDRRYVIVFNGEIYNYLELKQELKRKGARFLNHTDTEMILEAYRYWGVRCVKRFNGMWSFCIYDTQKQELFFSRDRFAIKPLYFLERDDVIAFASEAKAIIAAFPEENVPDYNMVYRYFGAAPEDRDEMSYYKNIKIFRPATCLIYNLQTHKKRKYVYWEADEEKFKKKWMKGRNPMKTFRYLLEDAIKLRLRADVEVGACLSGGLDSSTIVGICSKKYGIKMHTFSSVYPDKDCDEKNYIDLVNKYNGTIPHLIYPDSEQISLLEAFDKINYHHDGPSRGASLYSQYAVMQGIQGNVKVVLDGQGADELFAGYLSYYGHYLSDLLNKNTLLSRLQAMKTIAYITKEWPEIYDSIHTDILIHIFGIDLHKKLLKKINHKKNLVLENGNHPLFTNGFLDYVDKEILYSEPKVSGVLNTRLCKDIIRDSIPTLLHNEDGNSMAFSIESRVPFLDYRIVEFALALDGTYKIHNEWTKWIIRKSCRKYLPKQVAKRKNKMGFPAPFARWLRESGEKDDMKALIYSFGERGIVPRDTIDFYYQQHIENKADWSDLLYKFLALELWLRSCDTSQACF